VDDDVSVSVLTHQDNAALYALTDSDRNYLRKWLPWVDATKSPDVTQSFIANSLRQLANNNGFQAGIRYQGQLVGCIGLHGIDWANRWTSIGYWLRESHQGRGIMTRAVSGVLQISFTHYALNRVEIRAAVDNAKSRAIPERLGFDQEGTIKQAEWLYDHFVDHAIYGLLRQTWISPVSQSAT
jgi:ribosomal-protein-serine acetyltransferase